MTSLPTLLLLLLLLLWWSPFQLSLSFPVIPSAAMCNLVYPKHGEMLPVNVDDEGKVIRRDVRVGVGRDI